MASLRIAFLTNEFVIETPSGGGLGNYLHRISRTLRQLGHEPEIFVQRKHTKTPTIVDFSGVRVEHVDVARNRFYWWFQRFDRRFLQSPWDGPAEYVSSAWGLARALNRRHAEKPFDFVQSTNCGASGLFVSNLPNRPHLTRLSSIRELTFAADGLSNRPGARLMIWLEWLAVKRANVIYAPSKFISKYYQTHKNAEIKVLRPPVFIETPPESDLSIPLPARYLIHFGSIGPLKGSDVLAEALLIVWRQAPHFTMVWAGGERTPGSFERYRHLWQGFAGNVVWLGPLAKGTLYAVLKRAEAAVLPSKVDNLPNTVIESLMFGIPVIGSDGASIDELVEPGLSGELAPIGDSIALANALLKVWERKAPWIGPGFQSPHILQQFEPELAAVNLIRLAGY